MRQLPQARQARQLVATSLIGSLSCRPLSSICPSSRAHNLADFFTKPLRASVFFPMRDRILNVSGVESTGVKPRPSKYPVGGLDRRLLRPLRV